MQWHPACRSGDGEPCQTHEADDHPRSAERVEECLSLLQVGGVKALREPAVDFCQQLACVVTLALLLPQPRQTRGSPQFQGLGVLVLGNVEASLEARFPFEPRLPTLPQQALPFQTVQIRLIETLRMVLSSHQCLFQHAKPCLALSTPPADFCEQSE